MAAATLDPCLHDDFADDVGVAEVVDGEVAEGVAVEDRVAAEVVGDVADVASGSAAALAELAGVAVAVDGNVAAQSLPRGCTFLPRRHRFR